MFFGPSETLSKFPSQNKQQLTTTPSRIASFPVFFDFEVYRRCYAKQVLHKIIPPPTDQVRSVFPALSVKHVWHEQHVEIFVGFHQSIDQPHRLDRVNVVVDISVLDQ